ncbi:MAG: D-Ala-D-Ala carboxypeptidase family metallohydrolase [Synergistota bacterium]|nr:D-Ala-D-Ala carboxypeptidase family metallohydrolase [Synergistota bacterium]
MLTIQEVYTAAQKHPVNPLAVAVQTYHETGNYQHYRDWNIGGIKCTGSWVRKGRKCWNGKTEEYYGEGYASVSAGFRSYDSLEDFFADYADLIARLYPKCRDNLDNVFAYFAGLHGKWATDPAYFKSLVRLLLQLAPDLVEFWDPGAELEEALKRGTLEKWQEDEVRKYDLTPFPRGGEKDVASGDSVGRVAVPADGSSNLYVGDDLQKRLSENFIAREFVCPDCGRAIVDPKLVENLQILRNELKSRIIVTSGYRCKVYNEIVEGVEDSQHLLGKAADIVVEGWPSDWVLMIIRLMVRHGIIYCGYAYKISDTAVHFDVREPESIVVTKWRGIGNGKAKSG